jgi:hypothetical protein
LKDMKVLPKRGLSLCFYESELGKTIHSREGYPSNPP